MIRIQTRAATKEALAALEALRGLAALRDFYLAGGTALALRVGHRVSVDLDFFSPTNSLNFEGREALKTAIGSRGPCLIQEEKEGTLHLSLEGVAVRFLHYPYPLLKPLSDWHGVALASIEDIALMKLGAVAGRGARKDFLDMYAICKRIPLARLLRLADRKFKNSRDFALQAAKALVYFDDAEKEPLPKLLAPVAWDDVKSFFKRETPKAVARILKKCQITVMRKRSRFDDL